MADFVEALPFAEAVKYHAGRKPLPTSLSSAQLRALGAEFHRRNFTSARTLIEELLESYSRDVEKILNPVRAERDTGQVVTEGLNVAKAREQAKTLLESLGYEPDPDKRGTIEDLSSDRRINLVLETNVAVAQGQGRWLQGQDEVSLDTFPALELLRVEERKDPRDWPQRWRIAAAVAGDVDAARVLEFEGRMIARKDSGIWQALGDGAGGYTDTLGNPFEPFAFASGMGTLPVSHDEAEALGLIRAGQKVTPQQLATA